MYNLYSIRDLKHLFDKYGFNFSKSLGQNFLINSSICTKIVEASEISSQSGVIEVGPGIGTLTREIAQKAKKLVSVELDKRLIPLLQETVGEYKNVKIINKDILNLDLNKMIAEEFENFKHVVVCANLPYYITTPIIMKFLEENTGINSITVMVQKEAAERICAKPGSRECGAISVAIRYYGVPKMLFGVSKGSFVPAPKVDSSVISIKIDEQHRPVSLRNKELFFKVVKSCFAQRRKTLLNSLASGMNIDKSIVKSILHKANIASNFRAEQLTFAQFLQISNLIEEAQDNTAQRSCIKF